MQLDALGVRSLPPVREGMIRVYVGIPGVLKAAFASAEPVESARKPGMLVECASRGSSGAVARVRVARGVVDK